MEKLNTLDMEIALMAFFGIRANLIVPNISWGMAIGGRSLHECDLLVLSKSGLATEVEIKISKADLLKDKDKRHGHNHNGIANFFYAVPENLKEIALASIPTRAGLYVVRRAIAGDYVMLVKGCKRKKDYIKWNDKDRMNLARLGSMRILGLKQKVQKLKKKV